jgi:hypothetical protein
MAGSDADLSAFRKADEPSFADLLGDLARQSRLLLQQELALARQELSDKIETACIGAGLIAAGALLGFAGFIWLLAAVVIALSDVMPAWAAALVVGGAAMLVGIALVLFGRWRVGAAAKVPARTLRNLKTDAEWVRERLR